MLTTWVVANPIRLFYVGLHDSEESAWRIALGWPTPEEIAELKAAGWYAAPATITWQRPGESQ